MKFQLEGSITLLIPETPLERERLIEAVQPESWQMVGDAVAVETNVIARNPALFSSLKREVESRCKCEDPECPACQGMCVRSATVLSQRVDMQNATVEFCDECHEDALRSGLFT
jgi:hypothetical protein